MIAFVLFLFLLLPSWHSALCEAVSLTPTLGNPISILCLGAIFVQLKLQSVTAAALCCRCAAVDLELRGHRDPERRAWMSGDLCTQTPSQWHSHRYAEGDEADRCACASPAIDHAVAVFLCRFLCVSSLDVIKDSKAKNSANL